MCCGLFNRKAKKGGLSFPGMRLNNDRQLKKLAVLSVEALGDALPSMALDPKK